MVLVCRDPGFVFLKTRKTAGTSIEMALEPYCAPPGHVVAEQTNPVVSPRGVVGARLVPYRTTRLPGFAERFLPPEWHSHMSAADIRRRMGARAFEAALKISAVRNPFARTVSLFHWSMRSRKIDVTDPHAAFADWVRGDWPDDRSVVEIDGKSVVDRFVRYEHLSADLADVATALGLSLDLEALPHAKNNADARQGAIADYFDAGSERIVRDRLAWAFAAGGYPETLAQLADGAPA